jgi:hypothetical protein
MSGGAKEEEADMTTDTMDAVRLAGGDIVAARRIYEEWDKALGNADLEGSMRLYSEDATLESALVRHLTGAASGAIEGREALRRFVEQVYAHPLPARTRYRTGLLTDGKTLMWEYPRVTPSGQQVDLVEVMELEDGLIRRHRVYWGWFGIKTLQEMRRR